MTASEYDDLLRIAIDAITIAGKTVMDIYQNSYKIEIKKDNSPLTYADLKSNEIITNFLTGTSIPLISEESSTVKYETRKTWERFWIVDPLDGTKEFIQKNGEFTINIALVENQKPVVGIVYAPAINTLYFSSIEKGAFKIILDLKKPNKSSEILLKATKIKPVKNKKLVIAASRSHLNLKTIDFIENLKEKYPSVKVINKGSSLKFCLVAEGLANIYPRFGRTMEWDSAAGHAIINATGGKIFTPDDGNELIYNKSELHNLDFIAVDTFNINTDLLL
jgi:3'(2'), 5'-bisphosphate nucleotidase